MTPADLDLAAAERVKLRHPLVRDELKAIFAEFAAEFGLAPGGRSERPLSVRDVAAEQGVTEDTVRGWVRKGLKATRAPGVKSFRIRREDLERFLAGENTGTEPHNPPPVDLTAERAARARRLADSVKAPVDPRGRR